MALPKGVVRYGGPPRAPRRSGPQAANEDLLTERPTLGVPRLCHNAQTDLLRKQQVRSSNLRVGSSLPFRSKTPSEAANLVAGVCHNAEDLLTDRILGVPKASIQSAPSATVGARGSGGEHARPAVFDKRLELPTAWSASRSNARGRATPPRTVSRARRSR